jgi:hypothetical protein
MALDREPFRRYNLETKADIITIRLNPEERAILKECKPLIQQPKDSTAFKMLALIGAENVRHDHAFRAFLGFFFKNRKNNNIQGIPASELEN